MNCTKLISKFEEKIKTDSESFNLNGFDKGLEPQEILGATEINRKLHYLIKWKNQKNNEYVSSKQARHKCPELVIEFFEKNSVY